MKTAAEIMRSPVARVPDNLTAAAALETMRQAGVTSILVEPAVAGDAYGIFSVTDAVTKIVAAQRDLGSVTVGEAMSRPVITVPPQTSDVDCALLMSEAQIHRVLVHDGNDIVGVVSASDILGMSRTWSTRKGLVRRAPVGSSCRPGTLESAASSGQARP